MPVANAPFTVEVTEPDGSPLGWLCVDSVVDGLAFGGFRMTPSVTRAEVEELARCMTLKLAGHGRPTGGAKAGIRIDPTAPDRDARLAHFAAQVSDLLRDTVVLGKDMGATDDAIDRMYASVGFPQLSPMGGDAVSRLRDFDGYRRHMTGLGVAFAARAALGGDVTGARVVIQGAGLVGLGSAVRLAAMGARVVAMSDVSRCLVWREGVDVAWLEARVSGPRSLRGADQGDVFPREALFGLDADVVVLAASSYSVTEAEVAAIRAPLVVEGCNMGFADGARQQAQARGLVVIPDVIASSSSAAMVCRQLAARGALTEAVLWEAIERSIAERVTAGMVEAVERGCSVREAHIAWTDG